MSGKPYTLREMKVIVEYLTEHRAYGEVKGRKMWKDMADSNVTTRTWQSLKETFLKRIMPEIHNPYYNLTIQQISSFKQGYDVEERLNNKLEIRRDSANSNTDDDSNKCERPMVDEKSDDLNEDKNQEDVEKVTGEDPKQSDLRASTETLILENCFENAEEKPNASPTKSLRELITYSEPLTPMFQAVIDDFATDEGEGSNDEPKMQIVEHPELNVNNDDGKTNAPEKNSTPEEAQEKPEEEVVDTEVGNKPNSTPENTELEKLTTNHVNEKNDDVCIVLSESEDISNGNKKDTAEFNQSKTSCEVTQQSNTTPDTLLPDNQEAFEETPKTKCDTSKQSGDKKQDSKRAQKRAISQDIFPANTKRPNKGKQSSSDTDVFVENKREIRNILSKKTSKKNIKESADEAPLNKNSENHITIEDSPTEKISNEGPEESLEKKNDEVNTQEFENPCLKSVSLYEEQFSNTKYTDSEASNIEEGEKTIEQKNLEKEEDIEKVVEETTAKMRNVVKEQSVKSTAKAAVVKDVLILKSHSDSDSDIKEQPKSRDRSKQQRDKALANIFGFSSGAVSMNRRKRTSHRRHSRSRNRSININSDSSAWTSESGSEYVSPPRGRRNRQTKKYLKPKSARILSLDEEGGLFVMHGKKIYPVVKDGKIIKNYVTYTPEDDDDQEESFWKLKYVEEKKRTAELTKLLQQIHEKAEQEESRIPVFPTTSGSKTSVESSKKTNQVPSEKLLSIKEAENQNVAPREEDKTVKIKFTKNNEEVQFEGHWTHVNPVLAQVMHLLQKEPEATDKPQKEDTHISIKDNTNGTRKESPVKKGKVEIGSGNSTPEVIFDEAVQEKLDKMESEIFKEIERRDKEISHTSRESTPQVENVTKRKMGRPKKSPKDNARESTEKENEKSPAKKPKLEDNSKNETDGSPIQTSTSTRRSTRTPKKPTAPTDKIEESTTKTRVTRKSLATSKEANVTQDDVRYKLPSPPSTKKPTTRVLKNTRQRKSSSLTDVKVYSLQDNLSLNSIESSQGYRESDESPLKLNLRKKKKKLAISYRSRSLTRYRKRSHPYLTDDFTSDSSNSFQGLSTKNLTFQNSSLKSDVYKSESYRMLMNKNVTIRSKNSSKLDKIEEASPISELQYLGDEICEEISDFDTNKMVQHKENSDNLNNGSSSNITLPTSPALSIVENISISKSILASSTDYTFENKLFPNEGGEQIMLNELMKSEGDVSMPLMEQECGIETSIQNGVEYHYNISIPKTVAEVSESFLNKINTVKIEDPTITESIHRKLRDLILESAKKMEVDKDEGEKKLKGGTKVSKSKKRSSTPRKRQSTRKINLINTEPCIEEEYMETCSYSSRKSCPPVLRAFEEFELIPNENNNVIQPTDLNNDKPKTRKKKDVIKVKISKPKKKKLSNKSVESIVHKKHKSNQTDSGINETESSIFLPPFNVSVDLIHNHSETCLNANECLGDDSVEIVQNSTKSHISLDSHSSQYLDGDLTQQCIGNMPDVLALEFFSSDAQDVSVLQKVIGISNNITMESAGATYHTPPGSPDSLITEDLSDEVPEKPTNSKWYLLSEDEVSNTHLLDTNNNSLGYGANLNQIFPITCAIPDLSTITEMSKENGDSMRKLTDDTNTRNNIDSQSLFNN